MIIVWLGTRRAFRLSMVEILLVLASHFTPLLHDL
jgi:hypothetical protein